MVINYIVVIREYICYTLTINSELEDRMEKKKKTNKVLIIVLIVVALLSVGVYLSVKYYFLPKDTIERYGVVEEETVEVLVAKFNTEVMDAGEILNVASSDYLEVDDGVYWYTLVTGISLGVVPLDFEDDPSKEIVDYMFLYVDKNCEYMELVPDFIDHMIKANNSEITDEEIDSLVSEAKELSREKQTSNNGKGISIGYVETDSNYEYQVIRVYESY